MATTIRRENKTILRRDAHNDPHVSRDLDGSDAADRDKASERER